ncbi:MAG: hypothetical protein ACKO0Z_07280 [Betaproteobacteria bacterium]
MTTPLITRYRGDTTPDKWIIEDENGNLRDLTGCSAVLTVNRLKNPPSSATQVFQIVATVTAPTTGVVQFYPTSIEADQAPGKYYYDVQLTDADGLVSTIEKGVYRFLQDISK